MKFLQQSSFNWKVTSVTLVLVLGLITISLLLPNQTEMLLNAAKAYVFHHFSWFYILVFSLFLFFMLFTALSDFGNIKLGGDEDTPEFSFLSWLAMLFAAGMGVGLMFFGVAEPLSHYTGGITEGNGSLRAQSALMHTAFHWGLHAWAMYGVISLALAYFAFRYKLPLALRSCFYPLLKDKINGKIGDAIDILALIATLFGIITTLGFGSAQMGSGLVQMGWVGDNTFFLQVVIIAVVMSLSVISAISGVGRGVKLLSEINLVLASFLMLFVLATGPTLHLLGAFSDNLGTYLSNIVRLSFKTYQYDSQNVGWFNDWTVIYWAWWCSWAPFVGLFIARISRGRTLREFVTGVLTVPTVFSILWFSVFGNSAIWLDDNVANGALSALTGEPEALLFAFLDYLPASILTSFVALLSIALFFVTSADSGIYVLNNIASRDKSMTSPKWQAVLWGVLMSVVAIVLMRFGGIATLQSVTMIVALPFAALMLIMCVSLLQALSADKKYFNSDFTNSSLVWSSDKWQSRLHAILSQHGKSDILNFLKTTAKPAMQSLRQKLQDEYGMNVSVQTKFDDAEPAIEFIIIQDNVRNFSYGIKSICQQVSDAMVQDDNLPHIQSHKSYEPVTYFFDNRAGYEVHYMTKDELITDILKHYERYLSLMGDVGQAMMAHEQSDLAE